MATTAKEVVRQEEQQLQTKREPERIMRPPVDIYENEDGIVVVADMPGVSKERLNVRVENEKLVIEGDAELPVKENMEPIYADIRTTHYRRDFTLSGELDTDKVDAVLKDGVLTIKIPKLEEHKPRKIEVKVA